ncbi:MAG: hypothetical protein E7291_03845 [Lachnospiraceae bacterium]|nr:hypothetical protein [Lachnospiraceae bacterium]
MQELLINAWHGWLRYTDGGKFAALLLLVLLFFFFKKKEKNRLFVLYTAIMTVLCIFPVSAAVLMMYQTRFYDYEWIWNYVPVVVMIAYGGAIILTDCWERYKGSAGKRIGITAAVLALVFLSGSMGQKVFDAEEELQQRKQSREVLTALSNLAEEELCLWAPQEIMAEARAFDGGIVLPYGRNMWEASLGAYSYETYGKTEQKLYAWMCNLEETGTIECIWDDYSDEGILDAEEQSPVTLITGRWCMEAAKEIGVNCILLPDTVQEPDLKVLKAALGVEAEQLAGYYLFWIDTD